MIARAIRGLRRTVRAKIDPEGFVRSLGVTFGQRCRFIKVTSATFGSEPYLIALGSHVTVTAGVMFITHDGGVWVFRDEDPHVEVFAPITVGNNVFLGVNSIILPGVSIGDNTVIGAGAVVTKDIPAGSVAVGNPARVIKTIAEYKRAVEETATRLRGLSRTDKKSQLMKLFADSAKNA